MNKSVIAQLFPFNSISIVPRSRSADLEVNGLPPDFTLGNCVVLSSGEEAHGNMRRSHYLVSVGEYVAYLTICVPEYGGSLFALIRDCALNGTEKADDICKHARNSMAIVCGQQQRLRVA